MCDCEVVMGGLYLYVCLCVCMCMSVCLCVCLCTCVCVCVCVTMRVTALMASDFYKTCKDGPVLYWRAEANNHCLFCKLSFFVVYLKVLAEICGNNFNLECFLLSRTKFKLISC